MSLPLLFAVSSGFIVITLRIPRPLKSICSIKVYFIELTTCENKFIETISVMTGKTVITRRKAKKYYSFVCGVSQDFGISAHELHIIVNHLTKKIKSIKQIWVALFADIAKIILAPKKSEFSKHGYEIRGKTIHTYFKL